MRIKEYFLYPLICKFFNLVHPSGGGGLRGGARPKRRR